MAKEQFKPVKGYEGFYSIGDKGTVKGLQRTILHKDGSKVNLKEKTIQPWINRRGYVLIRLSKNGVTKTHYVHVLNADANYPKNSGKPQVNHIDCNKSNNELSNLERVSRSENMRHAYKNGLMKSGTKVIDICRNKTYYSIKEAAKEINEPYKKCLKKINGFKDNNTCLRIAA
jgi:hypothetical protein